MTNTPKTLITQRSTNISRFVLRYSIKCFRNQSIIAIQFQIPTNKTRLFFCCNSFILFHEMFINFHSYEVNLSLGTELPNRPSFRVKKICSWRFKNDPTLSHPLEFCLLLPRVFRKMRFSHFSVHFSRIKFAANRMRVGSYQKPKFHFRSLNISFVMQVNMLGITYFYSSELWLCTIIILYQNNSSEFEAKWFTFIAFLKEDWDENKSQIIFSFQFFLPQK